MDESLTSEDNAIVQVEILETLIVWFNNPFKKIYLTTTTTTQILR